VGGARERATGTWNRFQNSLASVSTTGGALSAAHFLFLFCDIGQYAACRFGAFENYLGAGSPFHAAQISRFMSAPGYAVLQAGFGVGESGDGAYAYFDTARDFGCILEAIAKPSRMWQPERVVPGPMSE
jgi:hypothetical protein